MSEEGFETMIVEALTVYKSDLKQNKKMFFKNSVGEAQSE